MVGVSDLTSLPTLDENSILENLKIRFGSDVIYTCIGNILIALNPYKTLKSIDIEQIENYKHSKEPHIFSFACELYANMMKNNRDQSVIISGESGAGKTESASYILACLSKIAGGVKNINRKIVSSSEVLEAFGNAKTIRNRNSSRFGKFIFIRFNSKGTIMNAHITSYLLEKSRIVRQSSMERSYHVFWYLLSGANDSIRHELKILPSEQYHYLHGSATRAPGINDERSFNNLINTMASMGFTDQQIKWFLRVISAILLTGNIEFTGSDSESTQAIVKNIDGRFFLFSFFFFFFLFFLFICHLIFYSFNFFFSLFFSMNSGYKSG
jgi:myosin heavy subunit